MNKIKVCLLIFFCLASIFLVYLVRIDEPRKNNQILDAKKNLAKEIAKKNIDVKKSQNIRFIPMKDLLSNIKDSKLLKKIDEYNLDGCFKLNNDASYKYYDDSCANIKSKINGINTPVIFNNGIPVKCSNDKCVKSSDIDWYDYSKKKFAYLAFVSNDCFEVEGEVIPNNKIINLFIWIPSFYYNEITDKFSYTNIFNININNHFKYTTSNHLPFAFYYKNVPLYGFWLQLDQNKFSSSFNNIGNYDLHKANSYDLKALSMFQNYYHLDIFKNISYNNYILSIGKGEFFYE